MSELHVLGCADLKLIVSKALPASSAAGASISALSTLRGTEAAHASPVDAEGLLLFVGYSDGSLKMFKLLEVLAPEL